MTQATPVSPGPTGATPASGRPVTAAPGPHVIAEDAALQRLQGWLPSGRIIESPQGPESVAGTDAGPGPGLPALAVLFAHGALIPLPDLGLLRVSGADAPSFLQAQLTNDVLTLAPEAWRWTGYCTPKGRLITTALNWRAGDSLFLAVARTQAAGLARRLGMYVLRAKAKVVDRSPSVLAFGLLGPAAAEVARALGFDPDPAAIARVEVKGAATLIRLDPLPADVDAGTGSGPEPLARALLWLALDEDGDAAATEAAAVPADPVARFEALLAAARRVTADAGTDPTVGGGPVLADTGLWHWTEVRSGVARLFPGSAELFVPQMVNFEAVGGVNFKKGCYPGQEIVARSQYLGKLKRRMFLGHLSGADGPLPAPGQDVHPQAGGEPSGQVVLSAPAPGGGIDLLFESQIAAVAAGVTIDGRPVLPRALPYTLA